MADPLDSVAVYYTPKKDNLQLWQNYWTISLLSLPNKVMLKGMLKFILNRLQTPSWRDLQPQNPVWKVPSTSAQFVPCLHRFQNNIWQGMACSLMDHHAEIQYQCKSSSRRWAPVRQCHKCSSDEWQHRIMVQNNSDSQARMSFFYPPSSTFFSKGLCLMLWKNMMERLA